MSRLTKRGIKQEGMIWFVDHENNGMSLEPCEMNPHHNRVMLEKLADYEDKQEQGLLLELPVPIGGTVWGWEYPTRIDEKDGSTWTICDRKRAKVVPKEFCLMMLDRMGDMYFKTEAEAEEALARMKGE